MHCCSLLILGRCHSCPGILPIITFLFFQLNSYQFYFASELLVINSAKAFTHQLEFGHEVFVNRLLRDFVQVGAGVQTQGYFGLHSVMY